MCDYNSIYFQIPFDNCLKLDRALHFKYIDDTNHNVAKPTHTKFLFRDHYGLYIQACDLDLRLNSPDPMQHAPLLECLVEMNNKPNHHNNWIRNVIISLTRYGLHLRDTD